MFFQFENALVKTFFWFCVFFNLRKRSKNLMHDGESHQSNFDISLSQDRKYIQTFISYI